MQVQVHIYSVREKGSPTIADSERRKLPKEALENKNRDKVKVPENKSNECFNQNFSAT